MFSNTRDKIKSAAHKAVDKAYSARASVGSKIADAANNHTGNMFSRGVGKATIWTWNMTVAAEDAVINWIKDLWNHAETVVILLGAGVGFAHLIGELAFYMALPAWIEITAVTGVIATLIVLILLKMADWRSKRRAARLAVA